MTHIALTEVKVTASFCSFVCLFVCLCILLLLLLFHWYRFVRSYSIISYRLFRLLCVLRVALPELRPLISGHVFRVAYFVLRVSYRDLEPHPLKRHQRVGSTLVT